MRRFVIVLLGAGIVAGCSTPREEAPPTTAVRPPVQLPPPAATSHAVSTAATLDAYKHDLAQRIAQVNSTKVYIGRPQALLRSVVVVKYVVDADGNLVRSEILRSNRDRETEATALAALRATAPFPKPGRHLMRRGQVEIAETWLFNNDGRFQLRTIAQPQLDR